MKNLELFEIQCTLDWLLKEQCELLKEQAFVDERLKHLDKRRAELEYQKKVLEIAYDKEEGYA